MWRLLARGQRPRGKNEVERPRAISATQNSCLPASASATRDWTRTKTRDRANFCQQRAAPQQILFGQTSVRVGLRCESRWAARGDNSAPGRCFGSVLGLARPQHLFRCRRTESTRSTKLIASSVAEGPGTISCTRKRPSERYRANERQIGNPARLSARPFRGGRHVVARRCADRSAIALAQTTWYHHRYVCGGICVDYEGKNRRNGDDRRGLGRKFAPFLGSLLLSNP